MASARLERTTVTLRDGTGQHELRATGQVVKFPGFLAVYEEGRDDDGEDEDESGSCCPAMARAIPRRRRR
jgi:DNA topoisomerase-1